MTLPHGSESPTAPGQTDPGAPSEQPAVQPEVQPQQVAAEPAAPVQPAPAGGPGAPAQHVVRRTRVGGVWVASALFALVLLLLLIFILQNGAKVDIKFFGANGHLPLGVALLLAAVLGVLLVVLPGSARIIQLRRTARKHRKQDAKTGVA
jgi:lipopolysaccharide assembly protein A